MNKRTYSILFLDDSPTDAYIVREAFRDCGYACHLEETRSIAEAETMLTVEQFDLVLADFHIDGEQADSFIMSTRRRHPRLPIVVLSGGYDSGRAHDAGANAFVHKPMDLDEFNAKVKGIMSFWIDVADLPNPAKR